MRNILAILERELKSYFVSPVAYAVLTAFTFISGFFFFLFLTSVVEQANMQSMQTQRFGGPPAPIDVPSVVLRNFLGTLAVILLFVLPFITMGLFSEEKKRGTLELLLTAPMSDIQTVLGKFLAGLTFLIIMLVASFLPLISLFVYSKPDLGPFLSGYLGLVLYGAALLSIGLFVSTLTENQIISAVITFVAILALWLINGFARSATSPVLKEILNQLAITDHLDDFTKGVIASSHIVFYLSFMVFGLFLTYRSIESLRWRG